jgi:hypothetical protein
MMFGQTTQILCNISVSCKYPLNASIAQFRSPNLPGSSRQTCYVKYNIILSAAFKAADRFVGCFLAN